jgi:hypothetical protein
MSRWSVLAAVAVVISVGAPKTASAECLEVGWRDASANWVYYNASVAEFNENEGRIRIRYEFKNGELELRVREKESASGQELIVLRGRWFERGGHSGRVRLEMEKGHSRAKGWYTQGDDESSAHFDFVLRECRAAPARFRSGDPVSVLWKEKWYNARILRTDADRFFIHYDGYATSWDEWVTEARMRRR